MQWETKKLPDGRWGIFLCKEFWKFKDKPVMYAAGISKELVDIRVHRMNNPNGFSNDEKCFTVGMERSKKKKEREEERDRKKKEREEERDRKKKEREETQAKKKAK